MSKDCILSIVIPCFNLSNAVRACLDSILQQNIDNIEIICIDDGSTDDTATVLLEYSKRIVIIQNEHNGVSETRNIGRKYAKGEWIWFVDGDDLITTNAIATVKANLDERYDVLLFGALVENGDSKYSLDNLSVPNAVLEGQDVFDKWITNITYPFVWNCVYKKSFLQKNQIEFDNSLVIGEDMAFQFAVFSKANSCKLISIPIYIYRYLCRNSSMKKALKENMTIYHLKVLAVVLENASNLSWQQHNKIFRWSYEYIVKSCFDSYEYLVPLHKIWKKFHGRLPFCSMKLRVKGAILRYWITTKIYINYRKKK